MMMMVWHWYGSYDVTLLDEIHHVHVRIILMHIHIHITMSMSLFLLIHVHIRMIISSRHAMMILEQIMCCHVHVNVHGWIRFPLSTH